MIVNPGLKPGSMGRNIVENLIEHGPMSIPDLAISVNSHYDSVRARIIELGKDGFIEKTKKTRPITYQATGKNPDELRTREEKTQEDGAWNDQEHREWMARYSARREQRLKIQGANP